jgi:hypothetical protein
MTTAEVVFSAYTADGHGGADKRDTSYKLMGDKKTRAKRKRAGGGSWVGHGTILWFPAWDNIQLEFRHISQ